MAFMDSFSFHLVLDKASANSEKAVTEMLDLPPLTGHRVKASEELRYVLETCTASLGSVCLTSC